jgi:lysophospholipase L1-like esterase
MRLESRKLPATAVRIEPRRARRLTAWLGSIALSLGVALAAGELLVRLTREPIDLAALRAASLEYERVPFARHAFPQQSQAVRQASSERPGARIGPRGYRGGDFAVPKPPGTMRVVILGGSAAFDPSAAANRDWPSRAEAILHDRGLRSVEVLNAGIPGHATADSLGRLFSELWLFEPDWVLVYHCWNDLKYFSWLSPDRSLLRGTRVPLARRGEKRVWNPFLDFSGPIEQLLAHSQLYLRAQRRYWEWRLGLVGPEGLVRLDPERERRRRAGEEFPATFSSWGPRQFELDLRLLVAASRAAGAEPVLLTQARLVTPDNGPEELGRINLAYLGLSHGAAVDAFRACDGAIREVARRERAAWLDASASLSGDPALFEDHVHLSEAGSARLASLVADFLAPLLGARAPRQAL